MIQTSVEEVIERLDCEERMDFLRELACANSLFFATRDGIYLEAVRLTLMRWDYYSCVKECGNALESIYAGEQKNKRFH